MSMNMTMGMNMAMGMNMTLGMNMTYVQFISAVYGYPDAMPMMHMNMTSPGMHMNDTMMTSSMMISANNNTRSENASGMCMVSNFAGYPWIDVRFFLNSVFVDIFLSLLFLL